MNILSWLIFGLVIGFITNTLHKREVLGDTYTIFLGALGGLVGGYTGTLLLNAGSDFHLGVFMIAVLGSLFIIYAGRRYI
jgi:uncharacterized membrane protein YeaQ/YmgE (transglycosylase-associated protein family)